LDQTESAKSLRKKLRSKKQEHKQIRREAKDNEGENLDYKRKKKLLKQEIFQLERELRAVKGGRAEGAPVTGTLPDFLIIGTMRGGTTYLYHLLSLHPLVEPCGKKELHFFDNLFDGGYIEWYRRCFPTPKLKDGRRTITGEATPRYLFDPPVPGRVARVIPQVRLIALLRSPVDRAYSHYQAVVRKRNEAQSFEEAIGLERVRPLGREGETLARRGRASLDDHSEYLSRSVYVDQLLGWSKFFSKEQMLVLKSEDFFERPHETLKTTFEFLGLPEWKPEASEIIPKKRNAGSYEQEMDPATRRRLEEYFEPHNRRLYDYLGKDFGW
jgi:Sulfotransferase domain